MSIIISLSGNTVKHISVKNDTTLQDLRGNIIVAGDKVVFTKGKIKDDNFSIYIEEYKDKQVYRLENDAYWEKYNLVSEQGKKHLITEEYKFLISIDTNNK